MGFLAELKRRNVIRVALAWGALAWLLIAIASLLFPALGLPLSGVRWLLLALGVLAVPLLWMAWRFELTAQGLRRDTGPHEATPQNARTARRLDQLTVVLVLGALSLALLRQFIVGHGPAPGEAPAPPVAVPAAAPAPAPRPPGPVDPHSIALLPFANFSPAADDAYFADGLSEELINVLARIPGLKVTSRSSSFLFRDSALGGREIAAQLGVAHLVNGSVRRQGDSVRISAQLVDAANDQLLWSGTYDRQLVDIFRVQEEISQAVANALADSLGVRTVQVAPATADLKAYELYLRGRQLFALRGSNLEAARSLVTEAVERDPRFAEAWATLAAIEYVLPTYQATSSDDAAARAHAAVDRALSLSPELPDALAVRSRLASDAGERLQSLALAEQALAADPNNANTWMWKGLTLLEVGHVGAAQEAFQRAQALDPLSGILFGWVGAADLIRGDLAQARANLERAHTLGWRGPASLWLLKLAQAEGEAGRIQAQFAAWLRDDGRIGDPQRAVHEAVAAAVTDPAQRDSARARVAQAVAQWPDYDWTALLLVLGLTEDAIAEAARPKPASGQILLMMVWSPADRAVRGHPGFLALGNAAGLLAFWDERGPPDGCALTAGPPPRLDCER
jgi:TolB-like protein/Flp pilus assembly protein TadD